MKILLLAIALAILPSCKKPTCLVAEKGAEFLGQKAGDLLQCKRVDLIKDDFKSVLKDVGICKVKKAEDYENDPVQGPIADLICPFIADYAADIAQKGIPAKWECSAVNAKDKLVLLLTTTCKQLPF